jgi:hypothetical protein
LNQDQDCHELKSVHSMELVWLKSFFLHRLKSEVRDAFICASHFPRLDLNQGRACFLGPGALFLQAFRYGSVRNSRPTPTLTPEKIWP